MINKIIPLVVCTVVGASVAGVLVNQRNNQKQLAALDEQKSAFRQEAQQSKGARDKTSSKQARNLEDRTKALELSKAREIQLEGELEAARNEKVPKLPLLVEPDAIIQALKKLKPENDRTKRQSVHYFESLVFIGPSALNAIEEFLDAGLDIEYYQPADTGRGRSPFGGRRPRSSESDRERKRREDIQASGASNYFKPFPKPGDNLPPTLRLGLLEAVAHIGGPEAEALLIKVLDNTLRGIEVAYLDIALELIAPGKYKERVLEITRDILAEPPVIGEDASKLDQRTKGYLYAILLKYKDEVFVETAKKLLIGADGNLDGYALAYLRQVLGERAMPILLAAYKDPRIINEWEKFAISDAALRFIGRNAAADAIFDEMVREGVVEMKKKELLDFSKYESLYLPIGSLMRDADEQTPEVLGNRRKLLGNVSKQSGDIFLQFGLSAMDKRLAEMQEKKTKETEAAVQP
jgi:hypothetical protein